MLIGLTKLPDKLLFSGSCPDYLSLRTSPQTGVAIPRLDVQCCDKHPQVREIHVFGGNRYLVPLIGGIATPACALVRNDRKSETHPLKQKFVELLRQPNKHIHSFPGNAPERLLLEALRRVSGKRMVASAVRQIGVCKDASQVTCHCEPVLRLVWQSPG